ncbi:SCO2400 family protein, partial [Streptomyces africanus]|uniref:SCO2400 family protein n=1 Tax=Streptomyces africanus TaxID=231024 RepID=UPI00142DEF92
MDYCDPCRRHLNGALACPGCGTSADALRWREPEYGGYDAVPEAGEGVRDDPDGPDGPDDEHEDDGEPLGRAARRRGRGPAGEGPSGATSRRDRKAAAHRRRRRRALFVAAGFVLAAGGLSLAELGMDAPKSTPKPAAAGDESADGDASKEAGETGGPGAGTVADRASGSPSPSVSDSPSASRSAKPGKSEDAKDDETPKHSGPASADTPPARPSSA